jgi:hypothetical protein
MIRFIAPLVGFLALISSSATAAPDIIVDDYAVYLGLNFASISTDSSANYDGAFTYLLGARASTQISPNFYLVPGAQLARRGFGIAALGTEYKYRQTYLEFPILFMLRLPSAGVPLVPYFAGGPNLGLKLASGCSAEGAGVTTCTASGGDLDANLFDLAIDVLAGAEFPMDDGRSLGAEIRYHHGLTSFTNRAGSAHHRGVEVVGSFHF